MSKELRTKGVTYVVTATEKETMQAVAAELNCSLSHLTRLAVLDYLGRRALMRKAYQSQVVGELEAKGLTRQDLEKLLSVL